MRPVPKLNKPEYRVIFYHQVTGDILKYKFMSYRSAFSFLERLDPVKSKPAMYKMERIH